MSHLAVCRSLLSCQLVAFAASAISTEPVRAAGYELQVRDDVATVSQDGRLLIQVALEPDSVTTDDPNGPEPLPVVDRAFLLLDRLVVVRRQLIPNYCTGDSAKSVEIYPLGGGEKEVITDYPPLSFMLGPQFESPNAKWAVILGRGENFLEGYAVFMRGGGHFFVEVPSSPFLGDYPEPRFVTENLFELRIPARPPDAATREPLGRMLLSIKAEGTFTLEEY